jgi:hypothetical protein
MEEIHNIIEKYDESYVNDFLNSLDDLGSYAGTFYKDVAEIYDAITRIKNPERNPNGFSLDDAPILGLLIRIWKLLKQIIRFYEENNAEFISILERPLIEAAVVSSYLLQNNSNVLRDYRLCSYKNRLRILRNYRKGSAFFQTKAGNRLLRSIKAKMRFEGLTENSFSVQKENKWKLQGKTFYEIFDTVVDEQLYASTYGMMSESIHGSWNDSMDHCLIQNDDGTFSTYPFFQPADMRYISPILIFCNDPYKRWLSRIDAHDPFLFDVLDWVARFNTILFEKFSRIYDE